MSTPATDATAPERVPPTQSAAAPPMRPAPAALPPALAQAASGTVMLGVLFLGVGVAAAIGVSIGMIVVSIEAPDEPVAMWALAASLFATIVPIVLGVLGIQGGRDLRAARPSGWMRALVVGVIAAGASGFFALAFTFGMFAGGGAAVLVVLLPTLAILWLAVRTLRALHDADAQAALGR